MVVGSSLTLADLLKVFSGNVKVVSSNMVRVNLGNEPSRG